MEENSKKNSQVLMLRDFSFNVPEAQVAQHPLDERESSKLLVWKNHAIIHSQIKNLADAIPEGSLFIVNNSRVIASRLHGKLASGGAIELLLLEPEMDSIRDKERWLTLGKPMRKLSTGTEIFFKDGLTAVVVKESTPTDSGPQPFTVELSLGGENLLSWLDKHGEMPLPPYISRKNPSTEVRNQDKERYQTVYAEGSGSVAAPTAGLHISKRIMESLRSKNCRFAGVTLHVGAGTFLPVKTQDPALHTMHSERFMVPRETLSEIEIARSHNQKIIVVGTTALRSLEGLMNKAKTENILAIDLADKWLRTDIFIRPKLRGDRYKPWCADALMTNFHQPESTLFMLICALVGYDEARKIYTTAVDDGYRFFSYGDSSLLWL